MGRLWLSRSIGHPGPVKILFLAVTLCYPNIRRQYLFIGLFACLVGFRVPKCSAAKNVYSRIYCIGTVGSIRFWSQASSRLCWTKPNYDEWKKIPSVRPLYISFLGSQMLVTLPNTVIIC
jgi:hypothetical protein